MVATLEAPSVPSSAVDAGAIARRFVWHDLMSTDREVSLRFFGDLFGWTVQAIDMGEHGEYQMLHAGGQSFGGAVGLGNEAGRPSHWISYIGCDDVDAVAARAAEIGGRVGVPPTDIPGIGRFAVMIDPQGAAFSAFQGLPGAPTAPESSADGAVPPGCPIWT